MYFQGLFAKTLSVMAVNTGFAETAIKRANTTKNLIDSTWLKGVQRPAAFATVCFRFCEFRTVRYSGSCGKQVVDFMQSMLVFVLPLRIDDFMIFNDT